MLLLDWMSVRITRLTGTAVMRRGNKTPHPLARSLWFVAAFVAINKVALLVYYAYDFREMSGGEFLNWLLLPEPAYICLPFALLICAMNMPAMRVLRFHWLLLSAVPSGILLAMILSPIAWRPYKLPEATVAADVALALLGCACCLSAFLPTFFVSFRRATFSATA